MLVFAKLSKDFTKLVRFKNKSNVAVSIHFIYDIYTMKRIAVVFMFICFSFAIFADTSSKMLESWNRLSETEKWMCLFSEPLMEQNKLNITTVNPEMYMLGGSMGLSQSLLENWWDLHSRDDVYALIEQYKLKQSGHNVVFSNLKEKLNQIPEISIEQIATKECMASYVISRLYFVAEMQDILGEHGLLAWDYGRILAVLRWSVAAKWISELEARIYARPFVDELLNAYDSWEDYAVHYAFGRVFYAFSVGNDYQKSFDEVLKCVKKYDIEVSESKKDKVFSCHGIKFPGKNKDGNHILKYSDAVYKPSEKAQSWMALVKIEESSKTDAKSPDFPSNKLSAFIDKNANIPAAAYLKARLIQSKELDIYSAKEKKGALTSKESEKQDAMFRETSKAIFKHFEQADSAFKNAETKSDLYFNFYKDYALAAYNAGDVQKLNYAVEKLDEEVCDSEEFCNIYFIYYATKAKECLSNGGNENAVEFAEKAWLARQKITSWKVLRHKESVACAKECVEILMENTPAQMIAAWNKLSEDEKWLCLFSEPVIENGSLSIANINPEKFVISTQTLGFPNSQLKYKWEISSKEGLLDIVEKYRLKQAGETVLFEETKAIFNQNPQISTNQIAIKECLECSSIVRLCVVSEMQDALGSHGMLAWDYGRILAALRFGVAVGWLDEEEAVSLAKPFIEELKNAYASWEDYASHYALGRKFSAYKDSYEQPNVLECVKKYDIEVAEADKGKVFTFHDIEFPGKNRKDNRILTYKDADFKFSNDTECWIEILECQNDDDMFGLFGLPSFVENNLDIPALADIWVDSKFSKLALKKGVRLAVRYLFRHGFDGDFDENDIFYNDKEKQKFMKKVCKKMLTYYGKASSAFEQVENKNDFFYSFYTGYAWIAFYAENYKIMESAISFLDEELCQNSNSREMFCVHYKYKSKESASQGEYETALEYAKKSQAYLEKVRTSPENLRIDPISYEKDISQMIADYESKIEND